MNNQNVEMWQIMHPMATRIRGNRAVKRSMSMRIKRAIRRMVWGY